MQDPAQLLWAEWQGDDDHTTPETAQQDAVPTHDNRLNDETTENEPQETNRSSTSVNDEGGPPMRNDVAPPTNESINPAEGGLFSTSFDAAPTANGHPPAPLRRVPTTAIPRQPQGSASPVATLRRVLHEIHIFMIAIGAVIGMGFYVRTGSIYHLGGSAAVLYSFAFLGLVTSAVMHNLAKMLTAWPVSGALTIFVEKFFDEDIAIIVGILYWFTYIFSFAGLTTTLGRLADSVLLNDKGQTNTGASVAISILSLLLPILFNLTPPEVFRHIELAFGIFKLTLAICVTLIMNVLNPQDGAFQQNLNSVRRNVAFIDNGTYGGWFGVLMTSIYLTAFGYVGVEAVAATSREAKLPEELSADSSSTTGSIRELDSHEMRDFPQDPPRPNSSSAPSEPQATRQTSSVTAPAVQAINPTGSRGFGPSNEPKSTYRTGDIFRRPAMLVPLTATFIYIWGGWSVMQNVDYSDSNLPSLVWDGPGGTSIFVEVADNDHNVGLSKSLTALLIVNLFSTSSTALYIASRTLYGMAYTSLRKGRSRIAGWLTKTKYGVPWVSVLVSAWLFWLPFTRYAPGSNANIAIDVIVEMGSVSCILVWGFESLAAFRLYGAYRKHYKDTVEFSGVDRDFVIKAYQKGWYWFHRMTSLFAVICCLVIIFVGGAMICKNNDKSPLQGIAAFLVIGIFIAGTILVKFRRGKFAQLPARKAFYSASLDGDHIETVLRDLDTQSLGNRSSTYVK